MQPNWYTYSINKIWGFEVGSILLPLILITLAKVVAKVFKSTFLASRGNCSVGTQAAPSLWETHRRLMMGTQNVGQLLSLALAFTLPFGRMLLIGEITSASCESCGRRHAPYAEDLCLHLQLLKGPQVVQFGEMPARGVQYAHSIS